jgi:hypothetical protein
VAPGIQSDLFTLTTKGRYGIGLFSSSAAVRGKFQYELINMKGALVQRGETMVNGGRTSVNLKSMVPPGLYILRISNEVYHQYFKIALQ